MRKKMNRSFASTLFVAISVLVVSLSFHAMACSMMPGYALDLEWLYRGKPIPANATFRFWNAMGGAGFTLTNAQGNVIPSTVTTTPIPAVVLEGNLLPLYGNKRSYTVLSPNKPLPKGSYVLRVGNSQHPFTVTDDLDNAPPPPPRKLKAKVVTEKCQTSYEANCAPIFQEKEFVKLLFDSEPSDKTDGPLVYEFAWTPISDGKTDEQRAKTTSGVKAKMDERLFINIPVWWLDGIKEGDAQLEIQLRSVDLAGNRSEPAKVTISISDLLASQKK